MSDIKLDIKTSELTYKDFTEDLGKILSANVMQGVSNRIVGEMNEALEYHIEEDVYKKYEPKVYPRRSENPGFGISLNDIERNVILTVKAAEGGTQITFNYRPSGSHSGTFGDITADERVLTKWGVTADAPIKPKPVHGDDLVRRIETGKGYDWKPPKRGKTFTQPRPFWANFVEEMIDGGGFAGAAKRAFKAEGITLEGDVSVERETGDGNY